MHHQFKDKINLEKFDKREIGKREQVEILIDMRLLKSWTNLILWFES